MPSGAGLHRFRLLVEAATQNICETPLRYRMIHAPFRRCLIPKFPYAVIFSVESDQVLIIAVAHTKRKPGYWAGRLEQHR